MVRALRRRFDVTVERAAYNKYGERVEGGQTHQVRRCYHWPGQSAEANGAYTQTTSTRVLTAPAGSDIVAADVVIYPDGSRWAVIGDPWDWSNPHVRHEPGLQVNLERAT